MGSFAMNYYISMIAFMILSLTFALESNETALDRINELASVPMKKPRHHSQRSVILFYRRELMGDELGWNTLATGSLSNFVAKYLSNKKTSIKEWKRIFSPETYEKVMNYVPESYTDAVSFANGMNPRQMYVFKPSTGIQGTGIRFGFGKQILELLESRNDEWVIQKFINPYLYKGRKTHFRFVSLVIVQTNGKKEFFSYPRMKMFTAPGQFDEGALLDEDSDISSLSSILLTNRHQSVLWFQRNPNHPDVYGKTYNTSNYIMDLETNSDDGVFERSYSEIRTLHSNIYEGLTDQMICEKTSTSYYDDACFYIVASDIAMDKDGRNYLLEMNLNMGFDAWTKEQVIEIGRGAASLMKTPGNPYHGDYVGIWDLI